MNGNGMTSVRSRGKKKKKIFTTTKQNEKCAQRDANAARWLL